MYRIYRPVRMLLNRLFFFVFCTLASIGVTHAETVSSWIVEANVLIIETTEDTYHVAQWSPASISVEQQNASLSLNSFAIANQVSPLPLRVTEFPDHIAVRADAINLNISLVPFAVNILQGNELIASTLFTQSEYPEGASALVMVNENAKLAGGGARVLGMDRSGHRLPLYNRAHYGFETHSEQMYYSMPVVLTDSELSIIWDNPANGWIDFATLNDGAIQFDSEFGQARLHFTIAESPLQLTERFTALTGRQPMPPRWALGMYASRFGYRSQEEVLATHQAFEALDFPLDALVIDLYWFGDSIKGTMGNLEWHTPNWPNPPAMIDSLKSRGVNTVLITEPFILSSSTQWSSANEANALAYNADGQPSTFDFYFGNTGLVDVFSDRGQTWFLSQYQRLMQDGVSGWWGDLGEPEVHPENTLHTLSDQQRSHVPANAIHNAYGHQWAAVLHQFLSTQQPETRPFIMMRSGYVGSQRYGMIPWSGDVNRSWGGLQSQVEISVQMGLQGLGYMHSDIGGFAGGDIFDAELYTRWFQYGVFQPVLRPHAQDNIPSEPVFHDTRTIEITRNFAQLRYQLMPYIYTMAYQNSAYGWPLMRPTYFVDDRAEQRLNTSQYLFGDALLVEPITQDDQRVLSTTLPRGVWFDFWSDTIYQGDQLIEYAAPIDIIPVWVKAGSFLPMSPTSPRNLSEYASQHVDLHYFHHPSVSNAAGEWYDDDGQSATSIEQKQYEHYTFGSNSTDEQLVLTTRSRGKGYDGMPERRQLTWVIHGILSEPESVHLNGRVADYEYVTEPTNLLRIQFEAAPLEDSQISIRFSE